MSKILNQGQIHARTHTHTHLPPVRVLLVEDLKDVSTAEFESSFFTGDQVVMTGVIVKVTLYKGLERERESEREIQ